MQYFWDGRAKWLYTYNLEYLRHMRLYCKVLEMECMSLAETTAGHRDEKLEEYEELKEEEEEEEEEKEEE